MIKKILIYGFILLLFIGGIGSYWLYQTIYGLKVMDTDIPHILYIETGSDLEEVIKNLDAGEIISHPKRFGWLANKMKYGGESKIKPGKYSIHSGLSYKELITLLRRGDQSPIQITIPVVRRLEKIASILGRKLETDSSTIMASFINHVSESPDIIEPFLTKVIPNTYQFLWNTSGDEIIERFENEHTKFWKIGDRLVKAKEIGLLEDEVYALASIVERETNHKPERPTIAGVYLNRLNLGIALQADPTVVYALGDFTIRRVLNSYLLIDSPYNTYKNPGLPPGPIGLASPNSIDAVLNAEDHDYLFFCAEPENKGTHAFASSLAQHNRNAKKFRAWLNQQGIRR